MGLISNGTTVFDAGAMASGFGGSMTFIKKLTASSSASLSFVDGSSDVVLDNTYKEYVFIFKDIHPATNGVTFTFQVSTDSGSSYGVSTTSTYFNAYHSESGANALNYEAIADIANATSEVPIIREDKFPPDKRVVFTPHTCAKTVKRFPKIEFFVQQSDIRCFSEKEYLEKGFSVVDDISNCDILIGVKEVPVEKLIPNKKYFFFSHTIKKQPYNKKLLQSVLKPLRRTLPV